ncbi:Mrpl30 family protein [Megaselia abdita]
MFKFMNKSLPQIISVRNYGKHNKNFLMKGQGIKHENITYYPRDPENYVKPELPNPSKMFRVQRIKPVKGCPYWEKKILNELGLDLKMSDFTIVKNIPENNVRLWKIKHLLKIDPIDFPQGIPNETNKHLAFIKDNGECVIPSDDKKRIVARIEAIEVFQSDTNQMSTDNLKRDSRMKWLNPY